MGIIKKEFEERDTVAKQRAKEYSKDATYSQAENKRIERAYYQANRTKDPNTYK